jgi:hypothetical protein
MNVRLMREGRAFDIQYSSSLSDDAVPALLENLPAMSFEQQCAVKIKCAHALKRRRRRNDFRTGIGQRVARREMRRAIRESLDTSNCPGYTKHAIDFWASIQFFNSFFLHCKFISLSMKANLG